MSRLVGRSRLVEQLRYSIQQAAQSDARVLITGESGTGKEVAARLIHAHGARAAHPLIAINCAGLAETLLESELFGHQRGSFTGAIRDKPGLLERAHRGTVFLDEVGEMSPRMQGLLLRFLESGEIHRVGADQPVVRVDVRVIAATNRNLADRVATGHFRLDLLYRLKVLDLKTPSLRERSEDVPLLLAHFLDEYARRYTSVRPDLTDDVATRLCNYSWPGNIRQLKNLAERLVVQRRETITVADLPVEIAAVKVDAPLPVRVAPPPRRPAADQLLDRMRLTGECFWSAIYAPFMSRDLTRDDVRAVTSRGLELTRGDYGALLQMFNMGPDDEKRFLNFLRKHQCQVGREQFQSSVALLDAARGNGRASTARMARTPQAAVHAHE